MNVCNEQNAYAKQCSVCVRDINKFIDEKTIISRNNGTHHFETYRFESEWLDELKSIWHLEW